MLENVLKKFVLNFIPENQKILLLLPVLMEKVLWLIFFSSNINFKRIVRSDYWNTRSKNKKIKTTNLTSPDIISLHKELSNLKKKKIENVLIEASSHGLKQGRLNGINFKAGIFTNLSQDQWIITNR